MPTYQKTNPVAASALGGIRSALRGMQEPSDSNVWKARLMGGLGGALEGALDTVVPENPGVGDMLDPMTVAGNPAAVAGSMATKPLKQIAQEAYTAVKGIPGLYSRLTDAATRLPKIMETAHVPAILKGLQTPLEEINYRKLPEMLGQAGRKVTRDQILEHLDNHPLELQRHLLKSGGSPQPHWESSQSLPATNYHESVITLPQEQSEETLQLLRNRDLIAGQLDDAQHHGDEVLIDQLKRRYRELVAAIDERPDVFIGPHWSEYNNVLGWSRSNQMNVPKMGGEGRVGQTLQSDWHQGGAARGYNYQENLAKYKAADERLAEHVRNNPTPENWAHQDKDWEDRANYLEKFRDDIKKYGPVPEAPFKGNWQGLLVNQDLLDAADNPDIKFYGVLDAPSQTRRWGSDLRPHFDTQVAKQTAHISKALKPYGAGELESFPAGQDIKNWGPKDVGAIGSRLPESTKELIRKYGFPAFSALMGLKMASSHEQEQ